MDKILERFFKKINFTDETLLREFNDASFLDVTSIKEKRLVTGTIKVHTYLNYNTYLQLLDKVDDFSKNGDFAIELSFKYEDETDSSSLSLLVDNLYENGSFIFTEGSIDNISKKIYLHYQPGSNTYEVSEEATRIATFLKKINCPYGIYTQEDLTNEDLNNFKKERDQKILEESKEHAKFLKEQEEINSNYQPCRLKDINNFRMVIVEGVIFAFEDRKTKAGKIIRNISISDNSDAITISLFEKKEMPIEEINKYSTGVKVRVYGKPNIDKYSNKLVISYDSIEVIDNPILREDTSDKKRVELHLHTKMSPFDGVSEIEDYVKMAKHFNMEAIAITDHDGVQAFPQAQKAGKKNGVKIIYGCEFSMISDEKKLTHAIYNPSDKDLTKSEFVVFDIETTGLSNRYDDIIEFGAVRYSTSFQIIDEIDFFVKTDKKLSEFTLKTSNITYENIESGKDLITALKMIKEFFKDSILVAHNAYFDVDFINEKLKENDLEEIKNPVIDTLPLARYLYPDLKSYREESLANYFKLSFSSSEAHRANYDARHLGEIFSIMQPELVGKHKIKIHKDIQNLEYEDKTIMSLHPYHVVVLAKNQEGIKDLYELVSDASIKHLNKQGNPILLKSILQEKRKNLLVGSSCLNGDVFEKASTKSLDLLKESMEFFDYIEVQPPQVYSYLINKGQIDDEDELHSIIKDIIACAKSLNKIVVATGDCHYVNREDKIFRDVIIATKGLRNTRHPLCMLPKENDSEEVKRKYYKNPTPNPDQEFLSTDEMLSAFSFLNDDKLVEEIVITNTNQISSMIENCQACKDGTYPPSLPGSDENLKDLVYKTAKEMYGDPLPDLIEERLETELKGIIGGGYSVHYYLSSIIIKWCNDNGYIVGSRGSVGSSLVATMSGITEVNPLPPHYYCKKCHHIEWADVLQYESGIDLPEKMCPNCHTPLIRDGQNIPFATFLGFKAEKVPDIDLNFPSDFQATAHAHMREILNKTGNTCYKAGTIQTIKDKKAYGYALGFFETRGVQTSKIRDAYIDYLAHGLYGIKASTGQHPGGIIVIPKGMSVTDFTPVQYPAGKLDADWETTHFDFHAIHDNVLKFDMLAHQDPVAIKMMCDFCNIKISEMNEKIPLYDEKALSIFWSTDALNLKENILQEKCGALGIPEFGTRIGRNTLLETNAHCFADLVRISGLSHGTDVYAGNARDLIIDEGKSLRDVIACRDDIMVRLHEDYGIEYTDSFQIMEIVRKGNFCQPAFAEKREKYTKLMVEHHVPDYYIASCEKIKYLFPRGHAVAYVSMAVRVAYFKVHHPLAYYATYFSVRATAFDIETMEKGLNACVKKLDEINTKIQNRINSAKDEALVDTFEQSIEMFDRGISFAKMDINNCHYNKFLIDEKTNSIIPSFNVIDGAGEVMPEKIYTERIKNGAYTSIENLVSRTGIGKSLIEKFKQYGLLDNLKEDDRISLFDFM